MPQKQGVFEFVPNAETLKILEALDASACDKYINEAIKAFAQAAPSARALAVGNSPAEQVNAELRRIFGDKFDGIVASKSDSDDYVVLKEAQAPKPVSCGIKDALDILKSLRQPITVSEVWEIMSVLG